MLQRSFLPLQVTLGGLLFTLLLSTVLTRPAFGEEETTLKTADRGPNLIYILLDDLGYADLDLDAYASYLPSEKRIRTPNLRALAEDGIVLTSYYAAGTVCSPTRASILTGLHPAELSFFRIVGPAALGIPETVETLPRMLKAEGYHNTHIGKWHLGWGKEAFTPSGVGFDQVIELLSGVKYQGKPVPNDHTDRLLRVDGRRELAPGLLSRQLTDRAIDVLKARSQDPGTPFFLNLWLYAPHLPFDGSTAAWREEYACSEEEEPEACLYAAMVSTVDEQIGRLLTSLDALGLRENTLIVVTSDNGGAWELAHPRMRTGPVNGPLLGHKRSFFEGGIRVPFIARLPGRIQPGSQSDALAISTDLLPTFREILDLPIRPELGGKSLLPILTQGAESDRTEPVYWVGNLEHFYFYYINDDVPTLRFAVREGPWKLLYDVEPGHPNEIGTPTLRLFDMRRPSMELERENLAEKHPQVAERLWNDFWKWLEKTTRIPLEKNLREDGKTELMPDDRFDGLSGLGFTILFDLPADSSPSTDPSREPILLEKEGVFRLSRAPGGRLQLRLEFPETHTLPFRDIPPRPPPADSAAPAPHQVALTFRYWNRRDLTTVRGYVDGKLYAEAHLPGMLPISKNPFLVGPIDDLEMHNVQFLRSQVNGNIPRPVDPRTRSHLKRP